MKYWLMKSEPTTFSIDDLMACPDQTDHWDGVRNYQARNFLRDEIRKGDRVLFYHSGKMPAIVGTARVVRKGYPDHTAVIRTTSTSIPRAHRTTRSGIWWISGLKANSTHPFPCPTCANFRNLQKCCY